MVRRMVFCKRNPNCLDIVGVVSDKLAVSVKEMILLRIYLTPERQGSLLLTVLS